MWDELPKGWCYLGETSFCNWHTMANLVSCSLSSSLVTLSALYFSPGLFFLIPLLIYSWGPCQIFISQPALWRLRSTVRFASWSLFLDLECELLVDLIDLFHGMYIWYCFLAWYMNFCLPFRCLGAANFSSVWDHLLRHVELRHQVWSTDLSFLTSVCCDEALESLNLSSEDIILVSEFEALPLACVCVWNGWLGHETGKRITFHPLSLDVQLEAEKWPSVWLS